MTGMTPEKATALRRPFPAESVGQLPKGGALLDFVGHAAVTDRLLTVDPYWTWEPFALDAEGLPAPDAQGNLWIRLTVCGVTRIGVGDGKNAKERIGDAIRNAAMRFGVALDLWAKENLVEFAQATSVAPPPPQPQTDDPEAQALRMAKASRAQVQKIVVMMDKRGIKDRDAVLDYVSGAIGRRVESRNELTTREASDLMSLLDQLPEASS